MSRDQFVLAYASKAYTRLEDDYKFAQEHFKRLLEVSSMYELQIAHLTAARARLQEAVDMYERRIEAIKAEMWEIGYHLQAALRSERGGIGM
jgi:predicted nucleic acid-binding protein